jgi:hypothetical protein
MNARGGDQYVKVLFDLEQDEDGYPPAAAETLWAVQVGDGLFQIDNIVQAVREFVRQLGCASELTLLRQGPDG